MSSSRTPSDATRARGAVLAALALLLAWVFPAALSAHPLDENNVYHFQACRLAREALTIDYRVVVGGLVANRGWALLDTDGDQSLSEVERNAFADRLRQGIQLLLDGSEISPRLSRTQFPSHEEFFAGQFAYTQIVLQASLPVDLSAGPHDVKIVNRNLTEFSGVFPATLVSAPDAFQATQPTTPDDGRTTEFSFLLPASKGTSGRAGERASGRGSEGANRPARSAPPTSPAATHAAAAPIGESPAASPRSPASPSRAAQTADAKPSVTPATAASAAAGAATAGEPAPLSKSQLRLELPPAFAPVPPEKRGVIALAPSLPPSLAPSPALPLPPRRAPLKDALRGSLGIGGLTLALGTALLLGMGHALTPGHGKSVVAAYLVGSRGTVWDAVFLGGVVTLTHTGSVLLLGLALLLASNYVLPEAVFPWLGLVSGALIVGMGFWMLIRGILAWYGVVEWHPHSHGPGDSHVHSHGILGGTAVPTHDHADDHDHPHQHGHGHQHAHAHAHGHTHEESHRHGRPHGHGHEQDHAHDHDSLHEYGHAHAHYHAHQHGEPHGHAHSHGHGHGHSHGHAHARAATGRTSRWGLLSLGMAGGMVPCPDAIVVLLAAVSLNRIALGLGLIFAFSLGLASVLIGIGILMVTAGAWMQRWSGEGRVIRLLPAVSGAVIMILGFVIAIQSLVAGHVIRIVT